jgi:hypothetical protein
LRKSTQKIHHFLPGLFSISSMQMIDNPADYLIYIPHWSILTLTCCCRSLNEATDAIPCWNQYYESSGGIANKDCGEKPPPTGLGYRYLIDDPAWRGALRYQELGVI